MSKQLEYKFTNTDLDLNHRLTYVHGKNTKVLTVTWYDENDIERITTNLVQIVDENTILLSCGASLTGENRLVLSYEPNIAADIPASDLLLPFDAQQLIKPMSVNNQVKYEQIAREVESLEVDKLLGSAFYQDVSANQSNYSDLLNGATFEDAHGNTLRHKGLRYVIAYLNYSKYIGEANVNDTFTGMVQKQRPDSEQISVGQIKNLQQENREIAFNAFELIRMFLNKNKETYTLWNRHSDKKVYKPVFYGVKKTIS